jgi:hypothetical protein
MGGCIAIRSAPFSVGDGELIVGRANEGGGIDVLGKITLRPCAV